MKKLRSKGALLLVLIMTLTVIASVPTHAVNQKLNKGDYIYFGKFYDQAILWRVIDFDNDGDPLLFSDRILTIRSFNKIQQSTRSQEARKEFLLGNFSDFEASLNRPGWEQSDLRTWLNSDKESIVRKQQDGGYIIDQEEGFLVARNFTKQEINAIKNVEQKSILASTDRITPKGGKHYYEDKINYNSEYFDNLHRGYDDAYYINVTDKVFILDVKQIADLYTNFYDEDSIFHFGRLTENAKKYAPRQTALTQYSATHPYWLRTKVYTDAVFSVNHLFALDGNQPDVGTHEQSTPSGVRPALYLKQSSVGISNGSGSKNDPYIFGDKLNDSRETKVKENTDGVNLIDISTHWGKPNIERLVEMEAISGYPDGTFKPNNTISFAEFLSISLKSVIKDVKSNPQGSHWASGVYSTAIEKGVFTASDFSNTSERFNSPITREDAAFILIRLSEVANNEPRVNTSTTKNLILDYNSISTNRQDAVLQAYQKGMLSGKGSGFDPKGNTTRAEAATIVIRLIDPSTRSQIKADATLE